MIGFLSGRVLAKSAEELLLLVGGVGYQLECPASTIWALPKAGEDAQVFVSMVVREDSIRLFGFVSQIDKKIFETLIGVSSVGPKLALALLGPMGGPELVTALHSRDESRLLAVPGVGQRKLEKLLVEMGPKLERLWVACQGMSTDFASRAAADASAPPAVQTPVGGGGLELGSESFSGIAQGSSLGVPAAGALAGEAAQKGLLSGMFAAPLEALVDERRRRRDVLADLESALSNIGHRDKFIRPCLDWIEKQWDQGTIAMELEDSLRHILQRQSARLVTSESLPEPAESSKGVGLAASGEATKSPQDAKSVQSRSGSRHGSRRSQEEHDA